VRRASHLRWCRILFAVLLTGLLPPDPAAAQSIATAVSVQGTVEVQRAEQTAWQPVKLNEIFAAGDTVRAQARSRADIQLLDQSVLRLNQNTQITLQPAKEERTGVVNLARGAAHFFSRGPRSLEVNTPFAVAGVRGTEFFIEVEPDRTRLTIFEGTVLAENPIGSLMLTTGQSAVAERGQAPVMVVVVRPRDAVHWTLYYPPVLYFRPDEFPPGPDWRGMVRQSIDHYLRGDVHRAFQALDPIPPDVRDPRLFAYRAHLLLAVGRVDEARADIEQALRLAPDDPNAFALQAIIAVVQGERALALETAQRAVQAAPDSATARIAESYARQAHFDLEGARASLLRAVELDPQNALAWARLSELWASFAELDRTLEAAQRAVALEPNLSRTQTVLGYAHLMRVRIRQAKEAFERAIALDSADPLPRLGLGLARIRESRLHEGSRDIEAAASLDPSNAIIRSYLGKAYFEEKRLELDEREYAVAKELDPNDPTPWFYDAITKQTTNRPVEALRSLERAIELNDNRAVYRSSLLLDADLAARSAALGRIYQDLGFEQLALVEGWKSVNLDPTNFSAHRFLADSYAVLPRHEIARVSELLQSQLLQPLNVTPIQPRLAESNLFLIAAAGPETLGFNEFNPLFTRDGVRLLATGFVGEHNAWAGEGVLSGIFRQASFSAGYTHFETDGWRRNADQRDRIANAFLQLQLSHWTSVQGEYRYRDTRIGDLQLNFFPDDFRPNARQHVETNSFRVGLRHSFSPHSILLFSVMYQRRDATERDVPEVPFIDAIELDIPDQEAMSWEVQHLFRSRWVNTVVGGGYFDVDSRRTTRTAFNLPSPPFPPPPQIVTVTDDIGVSHVNLYVYSYVRLPAAITLTLGISGDFFDTDSSDSESRNQANPKVGVVWSPLPGTTVRAAAFRVLKRTLITDQTLEPTQVAGFNQFFDDLNSTDAWRYGIAVDQKFSPSLFGGLEFARREVSIPFREITPTTDLVRRGDGREDLVRAYVYWTPHQWVALSVDYLYERFANDEVVAFFFRDVTTHRVPLGLRVFHPSGVSTFLRTTYVTQEGTFIRRGAPDFEPGHETFWVVDAAVSYRLPRRRGFVTVGATNLLDERFRFQETDFRNPTLQPARMGFARLTLVF
jgi:tetratricopeptide (TPR) repeat protein